ncbi:CD276 protein, partial [Atractosteus spatula]|nr:CD276 protein [Atractosteus spatula]
MWRVLTLLCVSCCPGALPLWVRLGDSVTLPCDGTRATGIPEEQLRIRWQTPHRLVLDVISGKQYPGPDYKNRTEVSREKIRQGNFSLTLHHTKLSDGDYYECYYRGNHDHLQFLHDVRLTVTARTETRTVTSGGDLSVTVFDDDEVEVLFHNTVVYPRSSKNQNDHVSVQNSSLIIHRVTHADQGIYTVRDRRTNRTISVITVTVTALPLSVPLGDSVTLPCDGTRATGIPEEQLRISWQTPDRSVLDVISGKQYPDPDYKNRTEVSREKIRQGNFSLTLHHTKLSDEDVYECYYRGNHDHLQFLNDVRLTVTARTETRTVKPGGDLSVPVFNDDDDDDDDEVEVLFHNTVVYPKSSDTQQHISVQDGYLVIHTLTQADQGSYTVRDKKKNRTISVITVTVTAQNETRTVTSGGDLSVPVFDDDEVEVLFNNTVVYSKSSDTQQDHVSVQNSSLIIHRVTQADQGSYTVRDRRTNRTISVITVTVTGSDHRRLTITGVIICLSFVLALLITCGIWKCKGKIKCTQ